MKTLITLVICILAYIALNRLLTKIIRDRGQRKAVSPYRIKYLTRTANIVLFLLFLGISVMSLGIGPSQLFVFFSSMFAVIGVALFAQWSILSNITASLIIFFDFPYRVGDRIEVIEKDLDLAGTIEEITLFNVLIRTDKGDLIIYPNNLMIQKPVRKRFVDPQAGDGI